MKHQIGNITINVFKEYDENVGELLTVQMIESGGLILEEMTYYEDEIKILSDGLSAYFADKEAE